ncbi:pyridoxamine 5'-phosphate oxidase [Mucisphaera sp.]|uniref:pyridoxamine 5'-phosphate oxidase n=1 Tax=Mucisphaera sp. TaxID=2913024 RepID=UPI003D1506F2
MSIDAMRKDYGDTPLLESDANPDPIAQFKTWFDQACDGSIYEPNAMTLATVDANGHPAARVVLLKGLDDRGFAFYTNRTGDKARQLAQHNHAALTFYWDRQHRQVRITGTVAEMPRTETETYFHSRPRGSQLGAWASAQSSVVSGRDELEASYAEAEARYANTEVPLPDHWGGYILSPQTVEFWQGRTGRLHDRLRYRRDNNGWLIERLAP